MSSKIYLTTDKLKLLLSLFPAEARLENLELGDTWHPDSGFVNESILGDERTVNGLINHAYDFKGLVQFEAKVGTVSIRLIEKSDKEEEYRIEGPEKELRALHNRIIEANAYHPDRFRKVVTSFR